MKKETNKKEMSFVKINIYLILCCFMLLSLSTIAYSALNQKLYISGDLALRAVKDLRITDLKYSSNTNSRELFNPKFTSNSITISNNPTSTTGSNTYTATIKNNGTVVMEISNITINPNSNDVTAKIINDTIKVGTTIPAGESVTFSINISGKAGSAIIEFTFKEYVPTPPNEPNLLNGSLTPVVYDETKSSWVVADTTKEWYNYSKQEWANAVILNSGVTKNVGDTVIVPTDTSSTSEVKAMLVWIPRYEYHIEGTYGTHLDGTAGTKALPGQIEVKFIPKSQTTADSNYILHPAFTWDDNSDGTIATSEHISGIWVGKFETTGTATAPTILPNVQSLRNQNISTQFNTSLKLKNYLSNVGTTDSHMAKNSEWGAVAYLSQSVYGKYGNTSYTGANKEVYKNDSSSYYTGRSSGTYPQSGSSSSGTYLYNDLGIRKVITRPGATELEPSVSNTDRYPWLIENGIYKSNIVNKNSTTTNLKFTFTLPESGALSFDWSVSSESASYDYVYYTIKKDGSAMTGTGTSTKIGGTALGTTESTLKYVNVSKELEKGNYEITFTYRKDSSSRNGTDTAYVKNIKVEYGGEIKEEMVQTEATGVGASTTGNITGIYDMAGGAGEYVMGYLTTASTTWGATSSTNDAGFTSAPASKYYDAYTSTTATTACNGGICKGHALSETSGWYNDVAYFVSADYPWFLRGGYYSNYAIAGLFYTGTYNGNASGSNSCRSVFLAPGA